MIILLLFNVGLFKIDIIRTRKNTVGSINLYCHLN
jgi:hypothetical protein